MKRFLTLPLLACVSACAVGPHDLDAHASLPPMAPAPVIAPASGPAQTVSATIAPEWWHAFGNAQLDALVAEALAHNNDVGIAEGLRGIELPADPATAIPTWHRTLNDEVVRWHRARGSDIPDVNELEARGINQSMFYCFPHWFVLPMYSSASSYRIRPLGPEETLMEIWSLARFAEGDQWERPTPPEVWEANDPRWPAIPAQDFSNLPRQQLGLHARGFEYMRLSSGQEGHIANLERAIDGFLAGLPHERLLPALPSVNGYPFDRPIADLGF